ncbi:uncharacterized protein VP01_7304g1 [Puccinia sorghi]|uniref:HAT C-terminal dimerisation domain-containing protein n=1 Tax=Puccinia sorghi TaxID=27349 RepID=A0A0L6UCY4_9BASI|nr:uncharacterized protein VP01_7304g1 [Puccinia sorghi]
MPKLPNNNFWKQNGLWTQTIHLMKLLEPLWEAAEILCGSNYPTLNKLLPIYILHIKHLKRVQNGQYYQALLIHPAWLLISKIETYLIDALKKPIYFCAILLDPNFKASFWKKNKVFIDQSMITR